MNQTQLAKRDQIADFVRRAHHVPCAVALSVLGHVRDSHSVS